MIGGISRGRSLHGSTRGRLAVAHRGLRAEMEEIGHLVPGLQLTFKLHRGGFPSVEGDIAGWRLVFVHLERMARLRLIPKGGGAVDQMEAWRPVQGKDPMTLFLELVANLMPQSRGTRWAVVDGQGQVVGIAWATEDGLIGTLEGFRHRHIRGELPQVQSLPLHLVPKPLPPLPPLLGFPGDPVPDQVLFQHPWT